MKNKVSFLSDDHYSYRELSFTKEKWFVNVRMFEDVYHLESRKADVRLTQLQIKKLIGFLRECLKDEKN